MFVKEYPGRKKTAVKENIRAVTLEVAQDKETGQSLLIRK